MAHPLQIGDRVALTRDFISSGAVERCDRHVMASRRGRIIAITDGWLAHVEWEDKHPRCATVNLHNICRPRSIAFVESVR